MENVIVQKIVRGNSNNSTYYGKPVVKRMNDKINSVTCYEAYSKMKYQDSKFAYITVSGHVANKDNGSQTMVPTGSSEQNKGIMCLI